MSLTSSLFFVDSLVLSSLHDVILHSIVINLLPARDINSEMKINRHGLGKGHLSFKTGISKEFSTLNISHNLFPRFRNTVKYNSDTRYAFKAYFRRQNVIPRQNKVRTKSASLF